MEKDDLSTDSIIYNDESFVKIDEFYDPFKLLLIGFLYCHYSDAETHASDMWLLLNPKLYDRIEKEKVIDFIKDLFYISVD